MANKVPTYLKMTLESLRIRMGLKQDEVAEKLGVSAQTIRKWEHNPKSIPFEVVEKFSELYCIPIQYIFFDTSIAFSYEVVKERDCETAI